MTDQEIRREYFKRMQITLVGALLLCTVAALLFGIILAKPFHPKVSLALGLFTLVAEFWFAANYYYYRNKPIFSRKLYQDRPALIFSFIPPVLIVLAQTALSAVRGREWRSDLVLGAFFLITISPPCVWFWKWRDGILRCLPADSALIDGYNHNPNPESLRN